MPKLTILIALLLLLGGCFDAQTEKTRRRALAKCDYATELSGLKQIKDQMEYMWRLWLCMKAEGYKYIQNDDGCPNVLNLSALNAHCWKSDD